MALPLFTFFSPEVGVAAVSFHCLSIMPRTDEGEAPHTREVQDLQRGLIDLELRRSRLRRVPD